MNEPFNKDAWILRALASGRYQVKKDGSVWRRFQEPKSPLRYFKRVKLSVHKKTGRVYFQMHWEGITKSVLVNRAVALKFIPNPEKKPEVNHKDGVLAHNWVDNLEWATRAEQEAHAQANGLKANRGSSNSNAKLTAAIVAEIRASQEDDGALAKQFGVSRKTITDARSGKTWSHL